jgi:hypothetical protein
MEIMKEERTTRTFLLQAVVDPSEDKYRCDKGHDEEDVIDNQRPDRRSRSESD